LSHCCTNVSSRSNARRSGFWQVMPGCAKSRPTDTRLNEILNFDQRRHHCAGPQRKRKLELQRVLLRHSAVNPLQLSAIEFRRTPEQPLGFQRSPSTSKRRQRQMLHDLGKDVVTFRHRALPRDCETARCARILARVGIETASNSMFSLVVKYITVYRPTNVGTLVWSTIYATPHLECRPHRPACNRGSLRMSSPGPDLVSPLPAQLTLELPMRCTAS
jgi:hypothetical protein